MTVPVRLGLAVPTIGRPALSDLLRSAARSTHVPAAVVVANQSGHPLDLPCDELPFPVTVIESRGGASAGRNAAVAVLGDSVDVLCFPNDDCEYPPDSLAAVAAAFCGPDRPAALAATLADPDGPRFVLPGAGQPLDARTVWLAVEPATFVTRECFLQAGGFREDLGTGCGSPWGSGEGTDLLLTVLRSGGRVVSRPDVGVWASGERRGLTASEYVAKHRAYARGTGRVYGLHDYPLAARLRILAGPVVRALAHDPSPTLSLRLARARLLGRLEGLRERPFGDVRAAHWRPPPPVPPEG